MTLEERIAQLEEQVRSLMAIPIIAAALNNGRIPPDHTIDPAPAPEA